MRLLPLVPMLVPVVLLVLAAGPASRPTTRPVEGTAVHVWPGRAPRAATDKPEDTPTLTCYWPPAGKAVGTSVVVCPGGGYAGLAVGHEGTDVARWLADHGVAAFVLRYRVNREQPAPFLDGQRAVRLVRYHARDWGLDPSRVGVMGFSAGGHVASSVGTHYDDGILGDDPVNRRSSRPDFMLLIYPVITMQEKVTHPGSKHILLGDHAPKKLVDFYSNELQVTDDTPPAFLAASKTDEVVPVKNSELFADALRRHKVAVEFLELPTGNHGYGMAPGQPELSVWTDRCLDWMRSQGLLTPTAAPTKSKP